MRITLMGMAVLMMTMATRTTTVNVYRHDRWDCDRMREKSVNADATDRQTDSPRYMCATTDDKAGDPMENGVLMI
jgi:hypothetical protein